ncbi:asparagine synthase-related protein [Acanthopleuribacter pedis]|uniref:asparagine synthase (glutamine-hydrolyzing) n=1 Tax=Acanthopleuribacter pedis TaxID=442870 RepID=A0A8J7U460_9BACT|nr:asparagine synthase-related protein [Acanthopleuribacter pedis]MBO1320297.1 hypothetical protein [Acanthopleuribacter pedis]
MFVGVLAKKADYRADHLLRLMLAGSAVPATTSFHEGDFAAALNPVGRIDAFQDDAGVVVLGSLLPTRRADLSAACRLPETTSAMGLVAAAYRRWGPSFVEHLAGEFALILWDPARRRLILARDRLGLHQLYVVETTDLVAVAFQPQPLFALPGVTWALDEAFFADHLALLLPPGDQTFYRDVRRLGAAEVKIFEEGRVQTRVYWEPNREPLNPLTREEAHEAFRELLQRAVVTRLDPAGVTAVFLSGGLDSTAITAAALASSDRPVLGLCSVPPETFRYRDAPGWEPEERRYVTALKNRYPRLDLHCEVTERLHPFAGLDAYFEAVPLPPHTPNNRPWMAALLQRAQTAGAGTVMVGQLGNLAMTFDGQGYVPDLVFQRRWGALWGEYRNRIGSRRAWLKSELVWPLMPHRARQWFRRVKHGQVFSPLGFSAVDPDLARRVDLENRYRDQMKLAARDWGVYDPEWVWYGLRLYAANVSTVWAPLAYQQGAAFCDPSADVDLVNFCLRLPLSYHQRAGRKRLLVREAMAELLPAEIVQRQKRGRQSPHLLSYCRSIYEELCAAYQRYARLEVTAGWIDWPRVGAALPRLAGDQAGFGDVLFVLRALTAAAFLEWHQERAGVAETVN